MHRGRDLSAATRTASEAAQGGREALQQAAPVKKPPVDELRLAVQSRAQSEQWMRGQARTQSQRSAMQRRRRSMTAVLSYTAVNSARA